MNNNTLKVYLEHFLADNREDIKTIRSFNENETMDKSKYLINNMIQFVLKKSESMNYDAIEMTNGDITKLKEYPILKNTIKALEELNRQNGSHCKEINDITLALSNIEALKNDFELAFKTNSKTVKLFYCNLVVAVICSTSFMVATYIELIKNQLTNDYNVVMKDLKSQNAYNILFIKNLAQFNTKYSSGEIQKFLTMSLKKKGLAIPELTLGVTVIAFVIVPLLRELIYQYYNCRLELSDYFKAQSEFLTMHQNHLLVGSKEAKRQAAMAEKFNRLADKVSVDMKVSSKKAISEITSENRTLNVNKDSFHSTNVADAYASDSSVLL